MSPNEPTIVKLGGSVITVKGGEPELRGKVVEQLATELGDGNHIGLVLGAGSYGHTRALQLPTSTDLAGDVAAIQADIDALLDAVGEKLREHGHRPCRIPARIHDRRSLAASYRTAWAMGEVPFTAGDIILEEQGYRIMSGDDLASELAQDLYASRLYYVSDVAGVLPGPESEEPIPELDPTTQVIWMEAADATGGMRHKVGCAIAASARVADVRILAGDPGCLGSLLAGRPVPHTRVRDRPQS